MTSHSKHYSMSLSDLIKGYLKEVDLDEKFNSIMIEGLSLDSRISTSISCFLPLKVEQLMSLNL